MKSHVYLPHIDGLRAIAVFSVLFYHLKIPHTTGGYIGVDVFFVISGYLITRLIVGELDSTGSFSFKGFYIRRVRRLFPALFATLAASFFAAFLLFTPFHFQNFSGELLGAVFSFSNILFWSQAGYFDAGAETKALLHTWSLSVEEQFYLAWPLALVLMMRYFRRSTVWALVVLAGTLSLIANHPFVHDDLGWLTEVVPDAAGWFADGRAAIFYLTPMRAFEFAIGAVLVDLVPHVPGDRRLHECMMLCGLVLIFASVYAYTDRLFFPYYYALAPCIGAALVILADRSEIAGSVVGNRLFVWLGVISYSLYLIHWPLIVFYKYHKFAELDPTEKTAIALAATALATLMYFCVETPFRRPRPAANLSIVHRRFMLTCLGLAGAACALATSILLSDGWAWRMPGALTPTAIRLGMQKRFAFVREACFIAKFDTSPKCHQDRPMQVLVIGNSHEPDGFNAFYELYGANQQVNLIHFGTLNRCSLRMPASGRPVTGNGRARCAGPVEKLRNSAFLNTLDVVVYSANKPFSANKAQNWRLLDYLTRANPSIKLVVFGGYLNQRRDCAELYNRFGSFDACKDAAFTTYANFLERESTKLALAQSLDYLYINNFALLCPAGTLASCTVFAGGEPVSYDRHHRTLGFSRYIGRLMGQAYGQELRMVGFPPVPVDAQ